MCNKLRFIPEEVQYAHFAESLFTNLGFDRESVNVPWSPWERFWISVCIYSGLRCLWTSQLLVELVRNLLNLFRRLNHLAMIVFQCDHLAAICAPVDGSIGGFLIGGKLMLDSLASPLNIICADFNR